MVGRDEETLRRPYAMSIDLGKSILRVVLVM
jgi:hypothetical protein